MSCDFKIGDRVYLEMDPSIKGTLRKQVGSTEWKVTWGDGRFYHDEIGAEYLVLISKARPKRRL